MDAVTFHWGHVPPQIVSSGPPPALVWRCYAWGHDSRGRYQRYAAPCKGCQVVREVRHSPTRWDTRR